METALEKILTTSYKDGMISFLKNNPEYFDEAIKLAISNKQPYSWRAAWLLWSCIEPNDKRIKTHIKQIISSIQNKNDGHQRELIKILLNMKLKSEYEGLVFDICMNLWEQIDKKPSVRFTAFQFIIKTVKKHSELSDEIDFLTQDHFLESLSPGIKSSVQRMAKELEQD